jgi:hypothetical protein
LATVFVAYLIRGTQLLPDLDRGLAGRAVHQVHFEFGLVRRRQGLRQIRLDLCGAPARLRLLRLNHDAPAAGIDHEHVT